MSYDNNEEVVAGAISERDFGKAREAVCVQVEKVYDSCKQKDCIENAKVLFARSDYVQRVINRAINVKCRRAEVADVYIDVEPVPFKRGFYSVDLKFFIKVTLDFFVPRDSVGTKIITIPGVVLFDKKVILFGSEGNVKIFKSHFVEQGIDVPIKSSLQQDNLPVAVVEVAEPICLGAKIQDLFDKLFEENNSADCCPRGIVESLEMETETDDEIFNEESIGDRNIPFRRVVASIGLFSIVKLIRNVQLLIPSFSFCVPKKKCIAATEDNPCELFDTISFPVDEFFPPQKHEFPGAEAQERAMLEAAEEEE